MVPRFGLIQIEAAVFIADIVGPVCDVRRGSVLNPKIRMSAHVGILIRIDRIIIVLGFIRVMDHEPIVRHIAVIHSGDRIAAVGEGNHIGAGIALDIGLDVAGGRLRIPPQCGRIPRTCHLIEGKGLGGAGPRVALRVQGRRFDITAGRD